MELKERDAPLVLIVDDERLMRIQLYQAIAKEGYRIIEATNGLECLELYTRFYPDIVLLDAIMPVMDGFTCCSKLKQLPRSQNTPVLIITGLDDRESVDLAFSVGAADYVTKPIHWAVLYQRIRRLIQQARLYQDLETANQKLQLLAACDGLTGIANRRRFDEYIEYEWRRLVREQISVGNLLQMPLSLIFADIDFFKAYNDTYGHQAGDKCLQKVATTMLNIMKRPADLVARYGGEEFAVILPNTDPEGALQLAEKMRVAIKGLKIPHKASEISEFITLSIGVSSVIPNQNQSPTILIEVADHALYKAKFQGRDRIIFHPG